MPLKVYNNSIISGKLLSTSRIKQFHYNAENTNLNENLQQ